MPFSPDLGIQTLQTAENEAHLEASILANPTLLPESLRPGQVTLCRQVPMSPFKPSEMDRADICYYSDDEIRHGSIPNTLIELKVGRARAREAEQVSRYVKWLDRRLGHDSYAIRFVLLALECDLRGWNANSEYKARINACSFGIQTL